MILWGLAGHIDHGKTSIVRALTGIDTDRLPEEKKRGMTTDLGFAWMELGKGEKIGLLDVPGHEQYVSHVVEGLYGCDAALLVVAADDGWMPQTEEHFQIIRLLDIKHVLVALNKSDTVNPEVLAEKTEDIRKRLAIFGYDAIQIIPVSGKTGEGISDLAKAIKEVSLAVAERPDIGNPRLSCDRVFSVHGSGLIVTGTVQHGMFKVGEEINIWPGMKTGRIRKIECFGESCSGADPGSRAGINITGIDSAEIHRGSLITRRDPPESDTVDIMVRMIPGEDLRKGDVRIYFETLSVLGRIVPLDDKATNEEGIPAQLILKDKVSAYIGERCILRDTSRHATIGGGVVLHHCASRIRKTDRKTVAERLRKMLPLDPRRVIMEETAVRGSLLVKDLPWTVFSDEMMCDEIHSLVKERVLVKSGEKVFMAGVIEDAEKQIKTYLKDTEKNVPIATLRSALQLDDEIFDDVLSAMISRKEIESDEKGVRRIGVTDDLTPEKAEVARKIIKLLRESSGPVLLADILSKISGSRDTVYYLRNHGKIIELTDTFFVEENRFKDMKRFVTQTIQTKGQLSIQDLASEFSLSRRPAVAVLTKFDQLFITQRRDNVRVAGKAFCVEKKD